MQQEPGSEAAAAFHLYEQERALIEQSMPEGQLREERLGQAQRRHDDVIVFVVYGVCSGTDFNTCVLHNAHLPANAVSRKDGVLLH
jgi:hypothetical protein